MNLITSDPSHRLNVLEQKLTVMQKEVNEVVGEMQQVMQALTKMTQVGLRVLSERLDALEQRGADPADQKSHLPDKNQEGKEL